MRNLRWSAVVSSSIVLNLELLTEEMPESFLPSIIAGRAFLFQLNK